MPSDEEIMIERMKHWYDEYAPHDTAKHNPIAPPSLMKPHDYGKQPSDAEPPKVETWRDRKPLL